MGRTITLFGQGGSGKSTMAANMACALAEKQNVVIILSAELNHGSVQVFFKDQIEKDKGTFAALEDKTEQPEKKLTRTKLSQNIYLMAAPNKTSGPYTDMLDVSVVDLLLRKLSIVSDYLIIDCTADLYNPITLMGIFRANHLIRMHKSTISGCLWQISMENMLSQLTDAEIHDIISEHNLGCGLPEYIEVSGVAPDLILPDVPQAAILENAGTPIYYNRTKQAIKYKAAIDDMANILIAGGAE